MKIQALNSAILSYTNPPNAWGIVINPGNHWETISAFLKKEQIQLRYILLTTPSFKNALRVTQIQLETGAKFLSFQSDLLKLRQLPREADVYNVCGIKTPKVDRFLDGSDYIELDGIPVQIETSGAVHKYSIDGVGIPHES